MKQRAYFTPTQEDIPGLVNRLLYTDAGSLESVSFFISADEKAQDIDMEEITITPVEAVCVQKDGFRIMGRTVIRPDISVSLVVDTSVDPPVAMFETDDLA